MILRCFWLLTTLLPYAFADVKFTSPSAGDSISGTTISIEWEEGSGTPPISQLANYQIQLCTGGNTDATMLILLTCGPAAQFTTSNSASCVFSPTLSGDTPNGYFLKMISAATGGVVINYSDRFDLSAMTGTTSPVALAGINSVSGTSGPPTENHVQAPQVGGGTPAAVGSGEFGITYTMQTGQIRYAPMPLMPQSKITAKNASPLYPTSAFTPYVTFAGPPFPVNTLTQPITFSVSSRENTATPVAQPSDGANSAMEKFLNRWRD